MDQYFLGVDNGGTVTKVAVYNLSGQEIGKCQKDARVIHPEKGFVERDIEDLISSTVHCVRGAVASTGVAPQEIVAVSVSCHGKGLYLLGRNNLPAYNGILSSDSRAELLTQEMHRNGTAAQLYPITFQQLWSGHPASLLQWFARNNPQVLEDTQYILMGHDYIRQYLTGNACAEVSNMSGSALVDVEKKEYSSEALSMLGLKGLEDKLAPLLDSTEVSGAITRKVAEETGLQEGTPVYAGFFDVVASAIASGLVDSSTINAVMGTWCISTCVSDSIVRGEYPYIWGNYCMEDVYFAHEGSPTSASNLGWFVHEFLGKDKDIFHKCNAWVEEAANNTDVFFFPFLYASNIKSDMPAALIGLRAHHTRKDVIKAIYEGVVFSHYMHLERLYRLVPSVEAISMVGGPTKSKVWMQMCANLSNTPIRIPNCVEAGCKGVALASMVACGAYSSFREVVDHTVSTVMEYCPQQGQVAFMQDKYELYKEKAYRMSSSTDTT